MDQQNWVYICALALQWAMTVKYVVWHHCTNTVISMQEIQRFVCSVTCSRMLTLNMLLFGGTLMSDQALCSSKCV